VGLAVSTHDQGWNYASWQFYYPSDGFWIPTTEEKYPLPIRMTNSIAQGIEGRAALKLQLCFRGWSLTNPPEFPTIGVTWGS